MIIWHIKNNDIEYEIEVGPVTVLKGSHGLWYQLVRLIDDYFMNKNSEVKIYEDTQLLHKKDWECLFIPFDAYLQLDKLNAKSPLRSILEEVSNELALSPIYNELLDIWEELKGEVELVNHKVEKYGLDLEIETFELEHLKSYISFNVKQKMMTPIEYKKLLLTLFVDKAIDKKRLIIIELPELFASYIQLKEFINMITQLSNKGFKFIIVTQSNISGNLNYVFEEKIINEARIEILKRKVSSEVPFYFEDDLYEKAKHYLLQAVDNSNYKDEKLVLSTNHNEVMIVIFFVMAQHLDIRINLDMTGISLNLREFIKSYS